MAEKGKKEVTEAEEKTNSVYISADIKLTRREAGIFQALVNAGITKTIVVQRALERFFALKPDEILEIVGLKAGLEHPEEVEINPYEFPPIKKPK